MAYFWAPSEQRVVQIDAALYAEWVETANPKAAHISIVKFTRGYHI
jgi:hypothetical protein